MAGLVSNWISSGTPACFLRAWSSAHSCGKYKRQAIGRLACFVLTDRLTATRQFSCLPTCPQYCRTKPTECVPFFGNRCHPRSKPALALFDAWPSTHNYALRPALLHRSTARRPLRGAATDASAAHCLVPDGPPLAPRFCVLPVTAILRNTSSTALPDRRAPRLAPGLLYMPQSASPAGLARSVCPQNNSTQSC